MLGELEDELIALVQGSVLGAKLRQVTSLPELDEENLVKRMFADAPAVYVSASPFTVTNGVAMVRFSLAGVARNARGDRAARHGDDATIGLYEIVDTLASLLDDAATAGSNWHVLGVNFLNKARFFAHGLHVGAVNIEGKVMLASLFDVDGLDAFETFHADYDLAAPDEQIDATDDVALEQ